MAPRKFRPARKKGNITRKLDLAYRLRAFIGACGKMAFESRSAAAAARKRLIKEKKDETPWQLDLYQCPLCEDRWHVGHNTHLKKPT